MDRKKDLIISGGFNIYPVDIEAVLKQHPAVEECTVIGMPSEQWGETPVGFYVPNSGVDASADEIMIWTSAFLPPLRAIAAATSASTPNAANAPPST